MAWKCTVAGSALESRITKIGEKHPVARDVLALMQNLFESIGEIYEKAAKQQNAVDEAIEAQTIAIVGAKNYKNTLNNMTPAQFALHLQKHFDAIGVKPPSWGEVAEAACDALLDAENDPNGSIRQQIKRALINVL